MKLRNKKTGETVYVDFQIPLVNNNKVLGAYSVTSLKELNESFEDYTPQEPRIKDEKIRKAVRVWADVNGTYPIYCEDRCTLSRGHAVRIEFTERVFADLDKYKIYTITELCGDEDNA